MRKLIEHVKKIALEDTRLFFEPLTILMRLLRRLFASLIIRFRRSNTQENKEDGQ